MLISDFFSHLKKPTPPKSYTNQLTKHLPVQKWSIPQFAEAPHLLKLTPTALNQELCCPHSQHLSLLDPHALHSHPNTTEGWLVLFTHHCCSETHATTWHPRAPLGVSRLDTFHLWAPHMPPAPHPRNKCDCSCITALKSDVSFLSPNCEIMRTARFRGIKKCNQAVSTSLQPIWGFCKDWIPKIITFWVTVLDCQRKIPQVLNHFIEFWAGFTGLSSLSPVCSITFSSPTTLRRFQIFWKGSVLFATWRLRSQVCCWIIQRGSHLLFGKDLMFLQKYLTRIMLSFSQFSSSIILCDL